MVRFLPYDQSDEESMNIVLQHIDFAIQYGEDLEFKEPKVTWESGRELSRDLPREWNAFSLLCFLCVRNMKKNLPPCLMNIFKNGRTSEVDYKASVPPVAGSAKRSSPGGCDRGKLFVSM